MNEAELRATYGEPDIGLWMDLLKNEVAYPIISVKPRWSQDMTDEDRKMGLGPGWTKDLPEGRKWNGTEWFEMRKEPRRPGVIINEVHETWWTDQLKKEKYVGQNPGDLQVKVELSRWEVWACTWFSHWTWDIGLDTEVVLESFHRFVARTERLNQDEGEMVGGVWMGKHCLMGAEDSYRWHGNGSPNGGRTLPPCRCEHCKRRGVVTINH